MIPRFRPPVDRGVVWRALMPASPQAVRRFESAFAEEVGLDHAIAFAYGRTAIRAVLESRGIRERNVVMPAYTCVVVAHAVLASGNRPVFIDSMPDDPNMDLERALDAIDDRTAAVMPTPLFGRPVDLSLVDEIRRRHPGVLVVQDCCHSFAIRAAGRSIQAEGDAAVFALNFSKIVTSVFGGMLATNDADLAERVRRWREDRCTSTGWTRSIRRRAYLAAGMAALSGPVHGITLRLARTGILDRFVRYFDENHVDMPSDHLERMTAFEAEVGLRSLAQSATRIETRRRAARIYRERLGALLDPDPGGEDATFSHFIMRHSQADRLAAMALRHGVELGRIVDYSVPDLPAYRRMGHASAPNAVAFSSTLLNLPVTVTEAEAARIAALMERLIRELGTTR